MEGDTLTEFIDDVCGESRLRVEADLGDGFVRLRSSEAERRQAAQDIRSSEDIVIELLRNARDAGARTIVVATQKNGNERLITVVDDGSGIPEAQHERIFEPRVTSKLDTAHMDKWGMHGRGMALYSIAVNATSAYICQSAPGLGTALSVKTDTDTLGEKVDQSSFPSFEQGKDGAWIMRGPKNLVRTVAEFALEHRHQCTVFFGSPAEAASTLYRMGMAALSPTLRAFGGEGRNVPLVKSLALAAEPADLAQRCCAMGLPLSERTARRIIDGIIREQPSMTDRLAEESFPRMPSAKGRSRSSRRGLKLSDADKAVLRDGIAQLVEPLADRYYLEGVGAPEISATSEAIRITIPIHTMS